MAWLPSAPRPDERRGQLSRASTGPRTCPGRLTSQRVIMGNDGSQPDWAKPLRRNGLGSKLSRGNNLQKVAVANPDLSALKELRLASAEMESTCEPSLFWYRAVVAALVPVRFRTQCE